MSKKNQNKNSARIKRHKHIIKKLRGTDERPRLVVFRSNKHIYVQVIDDVKHQTICTASTQSKDIVKEVQSAKSKIEKSILVGKHIAQVAKDKKIDKIVFDRNGYLYHGRVKALADGAREGGLEF